MRKYGYCLIFLLLTFIAGCTVREEPIVVQVDAKAAVIAEAKNGEVLYEKDPGKRYPPASTTKVMTAIVAIEKMSLNKYIKAGKKVSKVEPTVAGLEPGVKYRLKDLLAAILIKSANDAALAIAEGVAGSEEKFVRLMNTRARKLGMDDTYFATPSGLPTGKKDSQYTTARDLAKMMRYARRYEIILELMAQKEADIYGSDGRKIHLKTHNKSLFWSDDAPWGKTGYTREARRTFVGIDPSLKPRIVFSLLKSDDLWKDITMLKNKGLELYERKHRTFLSDLIDWISSQRRRGREALKLLYSTT